MGKMKSQKMLRGSNEKIKKSGNSILFWMLIIILGLLFANMCRIVFLDFNNYLNSDIVAEMKFVRTVVEDGSLFTQNWMAGHESFLSRPWFFAIPIYIITGSMVNSYKWTMVIMAVLILTMFYKLLEKLNICREVRFVGLIILLGMFNLNNDFALYSMSAYSVIIVMLILSVHLYLDVVVEKSESKIKVMLLLIIAAYSGLWGERLLLFLYIPLMLTEFYKVTIDILNKEEIDLSQYKGAVYTFLLSLTNIIGICVGKLLYSGTYVQVSTAILSTNDIVNNIDTGVISLTEELGITGGVNIVSAIGMNNVLKLMLIVIVVITVKKLWKKTENHKRNCAISYLGISLILTIIYLILTMNIIVPRYLILSRYLFAIAACYAIEYYRKKMIYFRKIKINVAVILGLCIIMTVFINISIHNKHFANNRNAARMQVADYLVDNEFEMGFATYWESSVIEGLTDGVIETGHFDIVGNTVHKKVWAVDKKVYSEKMNNTKKTALIITDDEIVYLGDGYLKTKLEGTSKMEIGVYNIYNFKDLKIDFSVG